MPSDSGAVHGAARLMPLTAADLHRLFTPSYQERKWAPTIARTAASQVHALARPTAPGRGQVLDDLTQMLLRLARRVEWKSEQTLSEWYVSKRGHIDSRTKEGLRIRAEP
jgi:hypothetical protein